MDLNELQSLQIRELAELAQKPLEISRGASATTRGALVLIRTVALAFTVTPHTLDRDITLDVNP